MFTKPVKTLIESITCCCACALDLPWSVCDCVQSKSVGEFLWLIDNAEYVVTSSFHGVAFSTILEKRFSAVVNEKLPSRISNLMELLDIPYVDIEKLDKDANLFDYQTIDKNISFEKERSIKYLTEEFEVEKQYFEV